MESLTIFGMKLFPKNYNPMSEELQPYVICLDCFEDMSDGIPKKDWLILYYTGKAGTVAFIPVHLIREGDAGNE
jgi:hypothetical protein